MSAYSFWKYLDALFLPHLHKCIHLLPNKYEHGPLCMHSQFRIQLAMKLVKVTL